MIFSVCAELLLNEIIPAVISKRKNLKVLFLYEAFTIAEQIKKLMIINFPVSDFTFSHIPFDFIFLRFKVVEKRVFSG